MFSHTHSLVLSSHLNPPTLPSHLHFDPQHFGVISCSIFLLFLFFAPSFSFFFFRYLNKTNFLFSFLQQGGGSTCAKERRTFFVHVLSREWAACRFLDATIGTDAAVCLCNILDLRCNIHIFCRNLPCRLSLRLFRKSSLLWGQSVEVLSRIECSRILVLYLIYYHHLLYIF